VSRYPRHRAINYQSPEMLATLLAMADLRQHQSEETLCPQEKATRLDQARSYAADAVDLVARRPDLIEPTFKILPHRLPEASWKILLPDTLGMTANWLAQNFSTTHEQ